MLGCMLLWPSGFELARRQPPADGPPSKRHSQRCDAGDGRDHSSAQVPKGVSFRLDAAGSGQSSTPADSPQVTHRDGSATVACGGGGGAGTEALDGVSVNVNAAAPATRQAAGGGAPPRALDVATQLASQIRDSQAAWGDKAAALPRQES